MKKSAVAGLAALTLLDISASTPADAQTIPNIFSGIYVGAHAGYFSGDGTFTSDPYNVTGLPSEPTAVIQQAGRQDAFDFDGTLGGVHAGFNIVTPGNFLFGIEGDWSDLGEKDSVAFDSGRIEIGGGDGAIFQHRSELELEWQGTIRGRLGVVSGNILFFATAGVAFLETNWSETATTIDCGITCAPGDLSFVRTHNASETLTGGVVGGGVEVAMTPNIVVGTDYLYENFENFNDIPFGHTTPAQTGKLDDLEIHKVRVRMSVKFNTGPQ